MVHLLALLDMDLVVERIAQFQLYLLPPIIAAVLLRAILRSRHSGVADAAVDRERTIRWIGLINYGLALRDLLSVIPELVAYRQFGGFSSFPITNVFFPIIAVVTNLLLGWGIRGFRPWARWLEVVFNAFIVPFIFLAAWTSTYGAAIDPASWPVLAILYLLPFFLVFVMVLPGTKRVFSATARAARAEPQSKDSSVARMSGVSMTALAFLTALSAVLIVDALYWLMFYGSGMIAGSQP